MRQQGIINYAEYPEADEKGSHCMYSWDTRSENYNKPSQQVEGHAEEINAVAWSKASPTLMLTGSGDHVSREVNFDCIRSCFSQPVF